MKPAIASIIDQFTHPSTCPTTPSPTSPLKLLHQSIPQHVLHKSLIRRRVAPRLQLHFLRHSPRETSRPLLARIRSDDVGDGCVGDKVWIETYVILIVLVNTLWCVMCNEVDPMEWLSGLRCLSRPSCLKFRRVSLVAFVASGPWPRARAQLHMSVYYSPKAANLSNQHHQLTLLVGKRYLVFAVEMNMFDYTARFAKVCVWLRPGPDGPWWWRVTRGIGLQAGKTWKYPIGSRGLPAVENGGCVFRGLRELE
jgi:hypothetical protein